MAMTDTSRVNSPGGRARCFLVLRGGGFSLVRATDGAEGPSYAILASAFEANATFSVDSQIQAIRAGLDRAAFRNRRVAVVLGDTWNRAHLLGTPEASPDVARQVLQNQLGIGESFCSTPVGSIREGNAVLQAHLAMSSSTADLNAVVRVLREQGVRVEGFLAQDGALMHWGRTFMAEAATGLRMVVIAEPSWLHFACYDAGTAVFIRRVETLPDLDPVSRATTAITEIQRTVLVVRGRLKTPELEGVVLVDPAALIDRPAAEQAAAPFGIGFENATVAFRIASAPSPAATGDAIRAVAADSLAPKTRRKIQVPCDLVNQGGRRGRIAAAFALMLLCTGAAVLVQQHKRSAALGSVGSMVGVDEAHQGLVTLLADARTTITRFEEEHRGLAAYLKARPPVSSVLDRIASAFPPQAVVQKLVVNRGLERKDAGRTAVSVRIEGLARGTLEETRPAVRAIHDALDAVPGLTRVAEESTDLDPLGKDVVGADRTLTRFIFAFQLEVGP